MRKISERDPNAASLRRGKRYGCEVVCKVPHKLEHEMINERRGTLFLEGEDEEQYTPFRRHPNRNPQKVAYERFRI